MDPNRSKGAAVVIDQERRNYLDEHLPYMLKMLRYTYGQMLQQQHYLSWNAHFESFAVHARNLVKFLTNGDTGNFQATQFVRGGYRARHDEIKGAMQKLEAQVFHLAKKRPREAIGKFSTEPDAENVRAWIEQNFSEFLSKLGDLRPLFNDEKADPAKDNGVYITVGPTGPGAPPQACTASPIVIQTHSTSGVAVVEGPKGPIKFGPTK
jgi:hypothetical protein